MTPLWVGLYLLNCCLIFRAWNSCLSNFSPNSLDWPEKCFWLNLKIFLTPPSNFFVSKRRLFHDDFFKLCLLYFDRMHKQRDQMGGLLLVQYLAFTTMKNCPMSGKVGHNTFTTLPNTTQNCQSGENFAKSCQTMFHVALIRKQCPTPRQPSQVLNFNHLDV